MEGIEISLAGSQKAVKKLGRPQQQPIALLQLARNLFLMFSTFFIFIFRTKWKRQTAVGLELLAEAGNYASLQRMYGTGSGYGWPYGPVGPVTSGGPPNGGPNSAAAAAAAAASMDLYYRQAAAAAALQKPLPYRLYPGGGGGQPGQMPGSSTSPISTSSPLPGNQQQQHSAALSPLLTSASAGLSSLAAASAISSLYPPISTSSRADATS